MRVLFAHGFEGGPEGSKPTYMRDVLGWDVTSPGDVRSGLDNKESDRGPFEAH